jgi:hypothetical protein
MAILFCEQELVPFYARLGWTEAPAGGIASAADVPLAWCGSLGWAGLT